MAVIEMSPGFAATMAPRIIQLGISGQIATPSNYHHQRGLLCTTTGTYMDSCRSVIRLMKGTPATEWVSGTSRDSDILCSFWTAYTSVQTYGTHIAAVTGTTQGVTTTINSIYAQAVASGLCTWFYWNVFVIHNSLTPWRHLHQLFGTVGLLGSGADLEIPDTSLAAGELYKIQNLKLTLPTSWTY